MKVTGSAGHLGAIGICESLGAWIVPIGLQPGHRKEHDIETTDPADEVYANSFFNLFSPQTPD